MHYLYLITREDGEQYVGVTNNISRRMRDHKNGQGNIYLKNREFSYVILDSGDEDHIYSLENDAIKIHSASLNRCAGGKLSDRDQRGVLNHTAKLNEQDVLEIRRLYSEKDLSQSILADKYKVSREAISGIVTGKRWSHVGGATNYKRNEDIKTPPQVIDEIIRLRKTNKTYDEIATILDLSKSVVAKYGKVCNIGNTNYTSEETKEKIIKFRKAGMYYKDIAHKVGVSVPTARKYAKAGGCI